MPKQPSALRRARREAMALNCELGERPSPCGVCTTCHEIAHGIDLDVIERFSDDADGFAAERLRDGIRIPPARDRYKCVLLVSVPSSSPLLDALVDAPDYVKVVCAADTDDGMATAADAGRCAATPGEGHCPHWWHGDAPCCDCGHEGRGCGLEERADA
jgi:DNA polymerase-3 subunit gamma/tau